MENDTRWLAFLVAKRIKVASNTLWIRSKGMVDVVNDGYRRRTSLGNDPNIYCDKPGNRQEDERQQ